MLASTVQFSNNDPKPTPHHHPPRGKPSQQFDSRPAQRKKQTKKGPHGPSLARPLRTQQRTYGSPPITSPFQLTPTKEWATTTPKGRSSHVVLDTHDKQIPELVSVPPTSTTTERTPAYGPEPLRTPVQQDARASCSLERR